MLVLRSREDTSLRLKRVNRQSNNKSLRNHPYYESRVLRESAVPNLSDRIGKRQTQSEIEGIARIDYTIDYQNPDNFDEVTITISPIINGRTYKQTVTGWDEAFEVMSNLESSLIDAYKEGIQSLLIDFSLAVSGDPDYDTSTDDPTASDEEMKDQELADRMNIDHEALKTQLKSIVDNIDDYVFEAVTKEISALGFIPTEK